jgi:hypothetical protein
MAELSNQERSAIVEGLGLTVDSAFVPFSKSRNAKEKFPSLNWKVTVKKAGREILTTDYMAGSAHCPSYRQTFGRKTIADHEQEAKVAWECEHGFKALGVREGYRTEVYGAMNDKNALKPDTLGVLHSLAMDSDVLDSGGFEDWASNFGYDVDSRKAEQTYRACLEIALKLRAALGDEGLKTLRNAFEGY